jgi:methionyl-tRNA formyltransferase
LLETKQLKACYANWNEAVNHYKKELNFTEPGTLPFSYDFTTQTINGEDAVKVIQQTQPDILIQAGAGILEPQIFTIPTRTTLNIHGAIAPKLRGGHSIFWSYYYGKPEWLGVTIHQIDSGIDTGLAYKRATLQYEPGIHPAKKIVECCTLGSVLLIQVIQELAQNAITPTQSNTKGTYKGFYSASQYQALQSNNWFPVEPNRYPSSI